MWRRTWARKVISAQCCGIWSSKKRRQYSNLFSCLCVKKWFHGSHKWLHFWGPLHQIYEWIYTRRCRAVGQLIGVKFCFLSSYRNRKCARTHTQLNTQRIFRYLIIRLPHFYIRCTNFDCHFNKIASKLCKGTNWLTERTELRKHSDSLPAAHLWLPQLSVMKITFEKTFLVGTVGE